MHVKPNDRKEFLALGKTTGSPLKCGIFGFIIQDKHKFAVRILISLWHIWTGNSQTCEFEE